MIKCFINTKLSGCLVFVFCIIIAFFYLSSAKKAYSAKIVAVVNESVITDVDVENFANALCKIEKKLKCNSPETMQVAMYYLIEAKLKLEHFQQTGVDFNMIKKDFAKHKEDIVKTTNIKEQNNEQFDEYLLAEYIWNIAISSQIKPESIKTIDVENFAKSKKIALNKDNFAKVKQQLYQQKYIETATRTLEDIKKLYLVDIKV